MELLIDLIIGSIIGTIILMLVVVIKRRILIKEFSWISIIFESYFGGFTIYGGFAAIWLAYSGTLPFGLNTVISKELILFIAGLIVVITTIMILFSKELTQKAKELFYKNDISIPTGVSINSINYYYDYLNYQENIGNHEMSVIKYVKDEELHVFTKQEFPYLKQNLLFNLFVPETSKINGKNVTYPSKELAVCYLQISGKRSIFKILKWYKSKEYKKIIKKIKKNDILELKPFIKLKEDPNMEKYNFKDIKNVKQSINNLLKGDEGGQNGSS